ncbi:MAG: tol-pal system YbgF family protein [Vicinamibacterales bacterium]
MKTRERHHLKENELAHWVAAAREVIEPRARQLVIAVAALVVLGLVVVGIRQFRQGDERAAEALLGDAMVALNAQVLRVEDGGAPAGELPAAATIGAVGTFSSEEAKLTAALPRFQTAADAYPDTQAGITARYHLGSVLAQLGRADDAAAAFDDVIARAGSGSLYGQMASLGKADALARQGQYDAAIAAWQALVAGGATSLPTEAILMDLARAYLAKGDTEEARRTLNRIVEEFPQSPYSAVARQELQTLTS